jgi:hypothetical protein
VVPLALVQVTPQAPQFAVVPSGVQLPPQQPEPVPQQAAEP